MLDMRKPRPLKQKPLSMLIIDFNAFNRNLVSEILHNLNFSNLSTARDYDIAQNHLLDRSFDVIFLAWEPRESDSPLDFLKSLRRAPEDRLRRLPVILITSGLTKTTVIAGRDAGADEFLARPLAPAAVLQRLQMVIEAPRPFVDCSVYVGPCRRRKNPAEYHGQRRRSGERVNDRPAKLTDAEEEAAKTPIRIALNDLRLSCAALRASEPESLKATLNHISTVRRLSEETKDNALKSSTAAFEAYIMFGYPTGQIDPMVVEAALSAMEQLSDLPLSYVEARDIVAHALGKAIQRRLAA
jgi:DNA-binding response OmpR family regulator